RLSPCFPTRRSSDLLPVARQLVLDGAANQIFLKGRDRGLNRQAVPRRRFDQRQVAQPHQAHVQRPRKRRGGERKRIDILAHLLPPRLVPHSGGPCLLADWHFW